MRATFYQFYGAPYNLINKEAHLVTLSTIDDIYFKEVNDAGNDLRNPVISITSQVDTTSLGGVFLECNYVYINTFKRYYYVDKIVYNNNGIIDMYLKCDVLMTFKEAIMQSVVYLKYTTDARFYNVYYKDDRVPFTEQARVAFWEGCFDTDPYYIDIYTEAGMTDINCTISTLNSEVSG